MCVRVCADMEYLDVCRERERERERICVSICVRVCADMEYLDVYLRALTESIWMCSCARINAHNTHREHISSNAGVMGIHELHQIRLLSRVF
jgi:hypothetical protein